MMIECGAFDTIVHKQGIGSGEGSGDRFYFQ